MNYPQFQPFMQYPSPQPFMAAPPESDNKALILATIGGGALLLGILYFSMSDSGKPQPQQPSQPQTPPQPQAAPPPAAAPAPSAAPAVRPTTPAAAPKPAAPAPAPVPRAAPPGMVGQHVQAQYRDGQWYGGVLQKPNLNDPDAVKWDAGTVPASMNPTTGTSPAQAVRAAGGGATPPAAPPGASAVPDFGAILGGLGLGPIKTASGGEYSAPSWQYTYTYQDGSTQTVTQTVSDQNLPIIDAAARTAINQQTGSAVQHATRVRMTDGYSVNLF